jgi:protease I
MSTDLHGRKVAVMVANEGVEQVELDRPWQALTAAGAEPVLVAPKSGEVQAFNHLDKSDTYTAEVTTSELDVSEIAGLVLPGGVANPDQLRTDDAAIEVIRRTVEAGLPIAVICHGPWPLVEAGVVKGRTITSWPSLRTDIVNAGGTWVDQEVMIDTEGPNTIVSSRKPDDLPAFCSAMIGAMS